MNDFAYQVLALAEKAGVDAAEVYQVASSSRPITFEGNRLKQLENSQSTGLALRLWRHQRPGVAVGYGVIAPEKLVERALAIAALNDPETIELNGQRRQEVGPQGKTIPVETLMALGQEAIAQLRDDYPELICEAGFESEWESQLLINSQGLHCAHTEIGNSYFIGGEWIRGDDFLAVYDGEYGRQDLPLAPAIARIKQRLAWATHQATMASQNPPVIFTPNSATLLWEIVADACNSKKVWEQSSPWSDRREGVVASPLLHISQDPQHTPYDCPFDDEGTPSQSFDLITEGRLQTFYSDRTMARQLGIPNTGNGFRGSLGRYPQPSLINLRVAPGEGDLHSLIAQMDSGLVVDQVLGQGADISGDFSLNVDLGYRVHRGEIVGRVKDTMIAGNGYEVLKNIQAIAADNLWSGSCFTPSILVTGIGVVS